MLTKERREHSLITVPPIRYFDTLFVFQILISTSTSPYDTSQDVSFHPRRDRGQLY